MTAGRRIAMAAIILTMSVVITLVALELLLRATGFSATPVDIQIGQQGDARSVHMFEDENFEYHPELIWSPRPLRSVFNSQGFRGPELPPAPDGALRVFTVGDSNTLGWAGRDGAHWPGDLAAVLDREGIEADVVNAGVWGYASWQGLRRFRQVLEYAPDIVLVSFGSNDAHWVVQSDRDYNAKSFRRTSLGRALEPFRLGELVISVFDGSKGAGELGPRVRLDDYRDNLRAMVTEGRTRGARVVLLTRPYIGGIHDDRWWKNRGADYNAATAEIAAELGAPLVDVYSFFKGRDDLFADESHFTPEGHRLAAELIFDRLRHLF